jgi:spore coat protein CotH
MRFGFGGPGPFQNSLTMLLGMPEVQRELRISDQQRPRLDEIAAELQEQIRTSFEKLNFQELQTLSEDERTKRFEEARRNTEALNARADDRVRALLDATQRTRLEQLRLQREGIEALRRPEVAEQLQLSETQRAAIRKIQDESRPQPINLENLGEQERDDLFARMRERFEKAPAEIMGVLSDEQRSKFAAMKGEEFKFPQGGFGFPGPGGFGPPGFGPGGPMGVKRAVVGRFDHDGDGLLNVDERREAREAIKGERDGRGRGPSFRPGGPGGPGFGPGGPGGPGFGPGGPGGPGPFPGGPGFGRGNQAPPQPGPRVSPKDVENYPDAALYEPSVLRTLFLDFENADWEAELADFHDTDVEVPATLTVDGMKYPKVGVHFRGMSSYGMVPAGYKRSLNLSMDLADPKQRLYGYKTLNLLNAHEDATFLHTVLYSHIARQYIAAPKANFVKVVINGESWGIYSNAQQFNKEFLKEWFASDKGARWKVRGNPGGDGGLRYLGENVDEYKRRFEIKSDDNDASWKSLIALCRALNETPAEQLEAALAPMLDIDGALWFLALDVALINGDGYWTRASDYSLFRDQQGKFHIIPHDMNEVLQPAMMFGPGGPGGPGMGGFGPGGPGGGPGFGPGGPDGGRRVPPGAPQQGGPERRGPGPERRGPGGPPNAESPRGTPPAGTGAGTGTPQGRPRMGPGNRGAGGVELDPLIGLDNSRTPLRSRLLAVPSLRQKYLEHVRTIAQDSLDWNRLGPVVDDYRKLIEKEIEQDTRKLESFDAFERAVAERGVDKQTVDGPPAGPRNAPSLRSFVERRRDYLLNHPEIKALPQ